MRQVCQLNPVQTSAWMAGESGEWLRVLFLCAPLTTHAPAALLAYAPAHAPNVPYLYGASLSAICLHASRAAAPYISEEAEAAVGEALGTLSVEVSEMNTLDSGTLSAWAATCRQGRGNSQRCGR